MEYKYPIVIAEIGCNHKGNLEIAKKMIKIAKKFCNADIVKFQKRDNKLLLSETEYNKPHPNENNSYGETYGKHREFLEFNIEQHQILKNYCESIGVIYSCSVWDINSATDIAMLNPDFIKIPSAQNTNYEMLEFLLNNYHKQIHISFGMTSIEEIQSIVSFIKQRKRFDDIVPYICTAGYPVKSKDVCLLDINRFKELGFKKIGFSGHHLGIAIDVAAYTLGAKCIERHFTLDRTWKGTDHAASLEPDGLRKLKRDLISVWNSLTYKPYGNFLKVEEIQRDKLKFKELKK